MLFADSILRKLANGGNFYRSVRSIATMWWGRQVEIGLYLGLFLSLSIIFLNDGLATASLWLVPTLSYANLVVLLYFAINFDVIAAKLLGTFAVG